MDYEHLPGDEPLDETDVSLRAYLSRISDEHLAHYDPAWTDEQVRAWDGAGAGSGRGVTNARTPTQGTAVRLHDRRSGPLSS